jgi:hypothetical protein
MPSRASRNAAYLLLAGLLSGCVVNSNHALPAQPTSAQGVPPGGWQQPQPQGQAQPAPTWRPQQPQPAPGSAPQGGWVIPPTPPPKPTIAIPTDNSWSLREREQWAALARNVQGALDAANDSCKAAIQGTLVWESFRGHFVPTESYGINYEGSEHARAPFNAIQQICDDGDMQRNAVRGRIYRIEVRFGGGPGRSGFAVNNGVLYGLINPAGESSFDYRAELRGPNGIRRYL